MVNIETSAQVAVKPLVDGVASQRHMIRKPIPQKMNKRSNAMGSADKCFLIIGASFPARAELCLITSVIISLKPVAMIAVIAILMNSLASMISECTEDLVTGRLLVGVAFALELCHQLVTVSTSHRKILTGSTSRDGLTKPMRLVRHLLSLV